jgi:ferritin-like protein
MSSENLHEKAESLSKETLDFHRAYMSVKEEIEAIDWYNQRIDAADEDSLKKILAHNRNEEMEHACMMLEWIRRHSSEWQERMDTYLFTEEPIAELEMEGKIESGEKNLNIGKS